MAPIAPLTTYRYRTHSCLLRVTGQLSALSQLASQPIINRLRFHLQLWQAEDQVEMPGSTPILDLRGEQAQLLELSDQVQDYVQRHLQGQESAPSPGDGWVTLTSLGLTRHCLRVNPPEPRVVMLSTLQLADLADVLEQMDNQVQLETAIIARGRPGRRLALPSLWIGSAASILVAVVLGNQWLVHDSPRVVRSPQTTPPEVADTTPTQPEPRLAAPATSAPPHPIPSALGNRSNPIKPKPQPTDQAQRPKTTTAPPAASRPRRDRELKDQGPTLPSPFRTRATQAPAALDGALEILRQTLQARWKVPAQLGESLRYQISLAPDGTVITVQPLTPMARDYQAQSGLPPVNQIIPGISLSQRMTLEVDYLPDGKVRVVPPSQLESP
ncbi:MAG: DUF4335 domain-containing protein [Nodosilinea sp.]